MSKTAMIWGAGGGIGRAVARALREKEWTTVGLARDPEQIENEVDHAIRADVTQAVMVQHAVMEASYEVEDVALWVYAAGDILSARVREMNAQQWERIVGANLGGPFLATQASLPLLAEDAHLFYLGAVSERLRLPGLSAYAAAKAGLEAWATALAKEERKRNVTVVRPGAVATPFWEKVPMRLPDDAATPEQIAARILQAYDEGHSGQLDITH
jgi:NAD(P)-dependent dehydrogenase (short-subunit alcohol dehydrogenase family)